MIIGLTGGIGSGKSIVARVFEMLGCTIFNSDKVAAGLYFDSEIQSKVIALLGAESYADDKTINKNYISQRIFNDSQLLLALNAIIHPAVGKKFIQFVEENKGKVIVKETALLFEAGIDKQVDKIVVVTAPEELRIRRVMSRDSLSKEEVAGKIRSQFSENEKISKADYVVHNDEKQFLITQVLNVYNHILNA